MIKINGFKAFNEGLINRYGFSFEEGNTYSCLGKVEFRNNGFHFCRRLEDTLRYFDGFSDIDIARVSGYGDVSIYDDEYNGYYDMYACANIDIIKVLSRDEIIEKMVFSNLPEYRIKRFIEGYKLKDSEIEYLINNSSKDVIDFVKYYQLGEKDVFGKVRKID